MQDHVELDTMMFTASRENLAKYAVESLGLNLNKAEAKDPDLEWVLSYLGASFRCYFEDFKSEYDLDAALYDLKVLRAVVEKTGAILQRSANQGKFVRSVQTLVPAVIVKPEVTILKNKGETIE